MYAYYSIAEGHNIITCLSTDPKPAPISGNNDVLIETNTGRIWYVSADVWVCSSNLTYAPITGGANVKAGTLSTARQINGIPFDGSVDISVKDNILAYQALGSPFLAQTVDFPLAICNTSTALVDGQIKYTAVYLPKAQTLTGIRVYVRVLGNYTGDNNNRVGLYSYFNGTITLVASSANNANLWKSAANAFQTIAFTVPFLAPAGIYFTAILFNNSAVVTAPAISSGVALNNVAMSSLAFTNSAKLYGTSNGTDLPASILMSAITASVIPTWNALY